MNMKILKKSIASGLSAALILTAPGIAPYEVLAQVFSGKQGSPVRVSVSGGAAASGVRQAVVQGVGNAAHFAPQNLVSDTKFSKPEIPGQPPSAPSRLGFAASMELPKESAPMGESYGAAQVQMDALEGIHLKKQGGAVMAQQGPSQPEDPGKLPGEIQPPQPWPAPGSKNPGDSGSGMVPGEPSGPSGPGGGIPSIPGEGGGPVPLGGGKGILAFLGRLSLGAALPLVLNYVGVSGLIAANVSSGLFVIGAGLPILGLSLVARKVLSRYDSPGLRSVRWAIDLALGASLASSALALPGILTVSSQTGFFNLLNEVRGSLSSVFFNNVLARENMIGLSLTSLAGLLALPSMMTVGFNLERLIRSAQGNVSYKKSRLEWPSAHWVAIGTVFALTTGLPHAALYIQAASILWSLPMIVPVLERAQKGLGDPQTKIKKIAHGVLAGVLQFSRLSVKIFDIGYLAGLAGVLGSLGIYAAGFSATPLLAVHPLAFVVLMYSPERMAKLVNLLLVKFLKGQEPSEQVLAEEDPLTPPPGFPQHHYKLKTAAGLVLALSLAGSMGVFVVGMKAILSSAASLIGMSLLSYIASGWIAVKAFGGRLIPKEEDPELHKAVEDITGPLGRPMPKLYEVNMPGNVANAFASGPMPRFAVMAFTGRIREITQDKRHLLKAIIAHEAMHIHHWDMAVLASLNWIIAIINNVSYSAVWKTTVAAYQLREAGKIAQSQYGVKARAREAAGIAAGLMLPVLLQLVMAVWAPTLGTMLQSFVGRSREAYADQDAAILTKKPLDLAAGLELIMKDVPPQAKPMGFLDMVRLLSFGHMGVVNPMEQLQIGPYAPAEGQVIKGLLLEMEKIRPGFIQELFYSHPPVDVRIEDLKEMDKVLNPPGGPPGGGLSKGPSGPDSNPPSSGLLGRLGSKIVSAVKAVLDASRNFFKLTNDESVNKAYGALLGVEVVQHFVEELNHVGLVGMSGSPEVFNRIQTAQSVSQAVAIPAMGPVGDRTSTYTIVVWSIVSLILSMILVAKVGFMHPATGFTALLLGAGFVLMAQGDISASNGISTAFWRLAGKDQTLYLKFLNLKKTVEDFVGALAPGLWGGVIGYFLKKIGDVQEAHAWTYLLGAALAGGAAFLAVSYLRHPKLNSRLRKENGKSFWQDLKKEAQESFHLILSIPYLKRTFGLTAIDFVFTDSFIYYFLPAFITLMVPSHTVVPASWMGVPVLGWVFGWWLEGLNTVAGNYGLLLSVAGIGASLAMGIMHVLHRKMESIPGAEQLKLAQKTYWLSIPGYLVLGLLYLYVKYPGWVGRFLGIGPDNLMGVSMGVMFLSLLLRRPADLMWEWSLNPGLRSAGLSEAQAEKMIAKLYSTRKFFEYVGYAVGTFLVYGPLVKAQKMVVALGVAAWAHALIAVMHMVEIFWALPLLKDVLEKMWTEQNMKNTKR